MGAPPITLTLLASRWNAMMVLLRTATGDNWSDVMIDLLPQSPARDTCDPENNAPCGTWIAVPFYATFVILVSFILLNIFMAVIIAAYEKLQEMADWRLSPLHLDDFVWTWAEYQDHSGTITPEDFLHVSVVGKRLPGVADLAHSFASHMCVMFFVPV